MLSKPFYLSLLTDKSIAIFNERYFKIITNPNLQLSNCYN
jgi:hypothetical protein